MGKRSKRRGKVPDWEDVASGGSREVWPAARSNSSGSRAENGHNDGRGSPTYSRSSGEGSEGQAMLETQMDQRISPYTDAFQELSQRMIASQKAMKNVSHLYEKHKRDIEEVTQTRDELRDTKDQCRNYKTTLETLGHVQKEKDEKYDKMVADVKLQRQGLARAEEAAEKHKEKMEEEMENFQKMKRETEAKLKMELDEQLNKLTKEHNEQYRKRVEAIEKETKKRQDDDGKKIADLEAEKKRLLQNLVEQESKLRHIQAKCKDQETLKGVYEKEVEKLKKDLREAENEFGLNAGTAET